MLRLNYLLVPVFWNSSREIIPNKLSHSKVNDAYEFIVHLKESTCTCGVVDWVDSFWLARGLIFLLTSFPYLLGSISNPDSPAIAWKLLQINATKQKKSQRSQAQKYQSFSVLYEALKYQNVRSGKHATISTLCNWNKTSPTPFYHCGPLRPSNGRGMPIAWFQTVKV